MLDNLQEDYNTSVVFLRCWLVAIDRQYGQFIGRSSGRCSEYSSVYHSADLYASIALN